jgi:hypothetical protein
MALFQSVGSVELFIVTSSNCARYGIMASPLSFSISPGIPSGPIHLFFPITSTPSPNDFSINGEGYA